MATQDLRVLQCLGDKSGTVNCIPYTSSSRGLRNRQFWMLWILQQFCQGDEKEDSSDEEEEPQKAAPKPAMAKPAAAEAAESGDVL